MNLTRSRALAEAKILLYIAKRGQAQRAYLIRNNQVHIAKVLFDGSMNLLRKTIDEMIASGVLLCQKSDAGERFDILSITDKPIRLGVVEEIGE